MEEEPGGERQSPRRGRRGQGGENRRFVIQQISLTQLEERRVETLLKVELADHLIVIDAGPGADHGIFRSKGLPGDAHTRPEVVAVGALKCPVFRSPAEALRPHLDELSDRRA